MSIFGQTDETVSEQISDEQNDLIEYKKLQIATCALFLEVANSDDEFLDTEKEKIVETMKNIFDLDNKHVQMLIEASNESVQKSVSIYEFTEIVNRYYDYDQKYEIMKNLWRLIFVDKRLDAHEEYFMRKITGNLHLDHSDMISSKLIVKKELNLK